MATYQSPQWLPQIRENMEKKPITELATIYATHDEKEWSPEAFKAIEEIFHSRKIPLPPITPFVPREKPKHIRSTSLNGIGTTLVGKRDFRFDDSYITTQWIILFWLPIFPLRSLRVRPSGRSGWTTHYTVYDETPPNIKQVLYTYGFAGFSIAWVLSGLMWLVAEPHANDTKIIWIWVVCAYLPALIPFFMRHYAKHNARA
jgi:hypothetical protein